MKSIIAENGIKTLNSIYGENGIDKKALCRMLAAIELEFNMGVEEYRETICEALDYIVFMTKMEQKSVEVVEEDFEEYNKIRNIILYYSILEPDQVNDFLALLIEEAKVVYRYILDSYDDYDNEMIFSMAVTSVYDEENVDVKDILKEIREIIGVITLQKLHEEKVREVLTVCKVVEKDVDFTKMDVVERFNSVRKYEMLKE